MSKVDAAIIAEFFEINREARHKNIHIDVDEYRDEFHLYDYNEKPPRLLGVCQSLTEVLGIVHSTWPDQNGAWTREPNVDTN